MKPLLFVLAFAAIVAFGVTIITSIFLDYIEGDLENKIEVKIEEATEYTVTNVDIDHFHAQEVTLEKNSPVLSVWGCPSLSELQNTISVKDAELNAMHEQINDLNRQNLLAEFGDGNVIQDMDLGVLYTMMPNMTDNLEEIFGISQDLSWQLNQMGVYRFKQIAIWTDSQVSNFQEKLNFDGSIFREQWVKQAQRLTERA